MTVLYLIRHGQASLHGDNYDVLSERGHEQALAVGKALAEQEPFGRGDDAGLTKILAGPLARQQDTARRIVEGYGRPIPVETDPAFSEYPAFEIFAHAFEDLRETDPAFAALAGEVEAPHKSLPIFAALIERWVEGKIDLSGTELETFTAFSDRVANGIRMLSEHGADERVAVVTSGGPIGVGVGHILGLTPKASMRLCWRIANASLTRLEKLKRDDQLVLSGMNGVGHLPPALRTWV